MSQTATNIAEIKPKQSLVTTFADKMGVEPEKLMNTLKETAFKQSGGKAVSTEQMMALLIVANEYGLNPFTKELYAFPDKGGIVPVVSVDGWSRIINGNPAMDGIEFEYSPETLTFNGKTVHEWIECVIYRKDRRVPIRVREFWAEVHKTSGPWISHPNRMHRHKAEIQCARIAFGFAGIYDVDEAERIIESSERRESSPETPTYTDEQKKHLDYLMSVSDDLGMYLFIESLEFAVYTSLYHSFPKGEKGKNQKIVAALQDSGRSKFEDLRTAVTEAANENQDFQIAELIEDLSDEALAHLLDSVDGETAAIIREVQKQASEGKA
jgi:phage recombination protein Bet